MTRLTKLEKEEWAGAFGFVVLLCFTFCGFCYFMGYEKGMYDSEDLQWRVVVRNIQTLAPQFKDIVLSLCNTTQITDKICTDQNNTLQFDKQRTAGQAVLPDIYRDNITWGDLPELNLGKCCYPAECGTPPDVLAKCNCTYPVACIRFNSTEFQRHAIFWNVTVLNITWTNLTRFNTSIGEPYDK